MKENRLKELLEFAESNLAVQVESYRNMLEHHMPDIVLKKQDMAVRLWEDICLVLGGTQTQGEEVHTSDPAPTVDMVNSPKHYTSGQYEVIDVIKDWLTPEEFRGYIKGNTIKYVSRERHKNGDEDMLKTIFYLNYLMHGVKSDGTPRQEDCCCEDYDDSEGR